MFLGLTLTAPTTAASNEHNLSKLKLSKTLMRNTMRQDRFKHVLKLACEKEITDSIDPEEAVSRWGKLSKIRRTNQ